MAIEKPVADPFDTGTISKAYISIVELTLNLPQKTIRITLDTYKSKAAYVAKRPAIGRYAFEVTAAGIPAQTVNGVAFPAIPGFDEILVSIQSNFNGIRKFIYTLLLTSPDFAGGTEV